MAENTGRGFISLDPDDAVSGGLLNNVVVEWQGVKASTFDFGGKIVPSPSVLTFEAIDAESGENYGPQYYLAFNADQGTPSDDGKGFVPVKGGVTGLWNKSRMYQLMASLRNNGFPKDKLREIMAEDITKLSGLVAHMVQEPALSQRKEKRKSKDGTVEYEDTVLVVGEIKRLPWEKAKKAGASTSGGGAGSAKKAKKEETSTAAAHGESGGDADAKAQQFVLDMVGARGGEVLKKDLPTEAFKVFKEDPDRTQIVKFVFDDGWLGTDKPWVFEDGIVKLG